MICLAEQELQKLKGHGCTVRHYSAQQAVEHLWIPHCAGTP